MFMKAINLKIIYIFEDYLITCNMFSIYQIK